MTLGDVISFFVVVGVICCVAYTIVSVWSWTRRGRRQRIPYALREFFGHDPSELPIVHRSFATVDLPNLDLGIAHYGQSSGAAARLLGYVSFEGHRSSLRELIGDKGFWSGTRVAAVQYQEVDIDVDRSIRCVEHGIHLITSARGKIAARVYRKEFEGGLELEVMAPTADLGAEFVEDVRRRALEANVYRRKIISLERDPEHWGRRGPGNIRFHAFPRLRREDIILPENTLNLIERNTGRFFQHAEVLRRSGRSLKRGLLLYGKPGTGKTYTARWLARSLEGVTVILLSGEQLWLIKECCHMARLLAPTLVIVEDVDLIASERDESRHPAYQITLHQLLNEMDGLTPDAEVLFLLTTNRPQVIEPALAARPGRIDQAIEFPLPDADCRRRLLQFYGRGLTLALTDMDRLVAKTAGASPAFIQELMRKAALIAAENKSLTDEILCVTDAHCDAALRELVLDGGDLTRNLLGFVQDGDE